MGRQLRVARSRQFVKQRKEDAAQSDGTSGELESEKVQADTANDNWNGKFARFWDCLICFASLRFCR